MKVRLTSGVLIDDTKHVVDDELDLTTAFAEELIGEGLAVSLEPAPNPIRTFYVDGANGSNNNNGLSASAPFATIGAALAAAVSGRGDHIFIMPASYEENLVVSKDYISLVGVLPGGYARPDVVPASGVPLTVTGQGFTAEHMRFAGTGADSAVQKGNGFAYVDCVFDGDGTANKAGLRLRPDNTNTHLTASEGKVQASLFRGCAIGLAFDTGAAPVGVGSSDNEISGNRFYSNTLDIAAEKTGAGGAYSVQLAVIKGNVFADKNKTCYIDITTNADGAAGSQSGTIAENTFAADAITTTRVKMVGTAFTFAGNRDTVGVVDGSALD